MAKKAESSSSSKGALSQGKTILGVIIIFALGYFAGMNHATTSKIYVESEPQRKEVALKTVEVTKNVFDKTVEAATNALHFIGDKLSSVGTDQAHQKKDLLDQGLSEKKSLNR